VGSPFRTTTENLPEHAQEHSKAAPAGPKVRKDAPDELAREPTGKETVPKGPPKPSKKLPRTTSKARGTQMRKMSVLRRWERRSTTTPSVNLCPGRPPSSTPPPFLTTFVVGLSLEPPSITLEACFPESLHPLAQPDPLLHTSSLPHYVRRRPQPSTTFNHAGGVLSGIFAPPAPLLHTSSLPHYVRRRPQPYAAFNHVGGVLSGIFAPPAPLLHTSFLTTFGPQHSATFNHAGGMLSGISARPAPLLHTSSLPHYVRRMPQHGATFNQAGGVLSGIYPRPAPLLLTSSFPHYVRRKPQPGTTFNPAGSVLSGILLAQPRAALLKKNLPLEAGALVSNFNQVQRKLSVIRRAVLAQLPGGLLDNIRSTHAAV